MRPLPRTLASLALLLTACGAEPSSPRCPEPAAPPPSAASAPAAAPSAAATAVAEAPPQPLDSDEGMWTFDNVPSDRLERRFGWRPTQAWLDHARLASARVGRGCSGSFLSASGLLMTNHHCASDCVQDLSSKKRDYNQTGFSAAAEKDEARCPGLEATELLGITDVTAKVAQATAGLDGAASNTARNAEIARIEKGCATSDELRCEVVTLYHGGQYHLYRSRRFSDVRLVFAPEQAAAFFGGDPDNFNFPRYDLDVAFLRAYDHDRPAKTEHFFRWSKAGAKEGEMVITSGHPYQTSRELTVAQLVFRREVLYPSILERYSELRGVLVEYGRLGKEQKRVSNEELLRIENSLKAYRGERESLVDPAFFGAKVEAERRLRARVDGDPSLQQARGAWDAIAAAQVDAARLFDRWALLERRGGAAFPSDLFRFARLLVRAAAELGKPNDDRLPELTDAQLPGVRAQLFSPAPFDDSFEALLLGFGLGKLREHLGADDPVVRKVLGKASPEELAAALVKGTKLKDPKVRKALFEGGKAAIDASTDPLIDLARRVDADSRAVRRAYEDRVEAVEKKNGELIARARFAVYGTSVYPDATSTLRLSFGTVKGWQEGDHAVTPFTGFAGAFDRATGKDPFALPKSWLDARGKLNLSTPLDVTTTNDIIGGNSGSPLINKDAEIVGLIFDGNIHSLGGEFGYDPKDNRAVAVHSEALVEALDKIYAQKRLLDELGRARK